MKFIELLSIVGGETVFTTGLLLAGDVSPEAVRLQLSRWVSEGRILRLRRGLYTLAAPYATVPPEPFVIANAMERSSYVSCQSALEWHGLIPEAAPTVVSVTPGRPCVVENDLGSFIYRHLKPSLLWGFRNEEMGEGRTVRIAEPEKALLDLAYLEPGGDSMRYMEHLRLQNLQALDNRTLLAYAGRWGRPKITRAAKTALRIQREETHP